MGRRIIIGLRESTQLIKLFEKHKIFVLDGKFISLYKKNCLLILVNS